MLSYDAMKEVADLLENAANCLKDAKRLCENADYCSEQNCAALENLVWTVAYNVRKPLDDLIRANNDTN
jgi:hypothetical protein